MEEEIEKLQEENANRMREIEENADRMREIMEPKAVMDAIKPDMAEMACMVKSLCGVYQPAPRLTLSAEGKEGVAALMGIIQAPSDLAAAMLETVKQIEDVKK